MLAAAVLLWLLVCWPLLLGRETLFFRDLFGHFAPLKAAVAAALREGSIPALNPAWALGQPLRGDPVASAFYPTNLLYLALPFWTAFNLHLCLHWLLAAVGMAFLAREMGASREGAALAALGYGAGGWMLSALSLYHIVAVAAWWPLVLLGAQRGGRRGIAVGGLACGLALLAGEPFTAALGTLPLAIIAVGRWGWRRGLGVSLAIGVLGLLVAMPQLVASARVLPFTFRGSHGVLASQAGTYELRLPQLLELVVPLPFGSPTQPSGGAWTSRVLPHVPFFYSLYPGVIATFFALLGARRRPALALLAVAAVIAARAPGVSGRTLVELAFGLFRSPEKALFWLALALPLLAAAGFDEARRDGRAAWRVGLGLAAVLLAAGGVAALLGGASADGSEGPLARSLVVAALLLGLTGWAMWRRRPVVAIALQLLALLPLYPLLMKEPVALYEQRLPWTAQLGDRRGVQPLAYTYPAWEPQAQPRTSPAAKARRLAFELGPTPGVLHGLTYPLAPDLDGMHHRFYDYLLFRLSQDSWEGRLPWLRTLGVEAITSRQLLPPGAKLVATQRFDAGSSYLYTLDRPAPAVWWPQQLTVAPSPAAAYELVAAREEPTVATLVPFAIPHHPGARVRLLRAEADRLELEVAGDGGVVVVRRAFQPLWHARAEASPLQVVPADLVLTGIVVPPGTHRVELFVKDGPEWTAAAIAALTFVALVAVAILPSRQPETPRPA